MVICNRQHDVLQRLRQDIEERKRAEDALRRSEAYLVEAERLSHTGSWVYTLTSEVGRSGILVGGALPHFQIRGAPGAADARGVSCLAQCRGMGPLDGSLQSWHPRKI